jgi:flagellar protein FlbD
MIVVTRPDRSGESTYAINPDLIERIAETPDTILHMVDRSTHPVAESMGEVIDLIARYRAHVLGLARFLSSDSGPAAQPVPLRAVDSAADEPVKLAQRK